VLLITTYSNVLLLGGIGYSLHSELPNGLIGFFNRHSQDVRFTVQLPSG
jgi:hypothetical protein